MKLYSLDLLKLSFLQESICLDKIDGFSFSSYSIPDNLDSLFNTLENLIIIKNSIPQSLFNIKIFMNQYGRKKWEQTNKDKESEFFNICELLAYLQYSYSNKLTIFKGFEERIENIKDQEVKEHLKNKNNSWIYELTIPVIFYN